MLVGSITSGDAKIDVAERNDSLEVIVTNADRQTQMVIVYFTGNVSVDGHLVVDQVGAKILKGEVRRWDNARKRERRKVDVVLAELDHQALSDPGSPEVQ